MVTTGSASIEGGDISQPWLLFAELGRYVCLLSTPCPVSAASLQKDFDDLYIAASVQKEFDD